MDNNIYRHDIWQNSPQHPRLEKDLVHLWRVNLDLPSATVEELSACLSPDEIVKADKFRFPQHKRRFAVARGVLRQLLGNYLQISPREIKFQYSDRGKPSLATANCDRSLQFNISHSQEYALYGFTYDYPIGVDLEHLREMKDAVQIAQRFFSPQEFQLIDNLDSAQQQKVFFKLWTAKEAYLKATGTGLSGSLTSINIGLNNAENPYLKSIPGSLETVKSWSMYPCIPASDYVGAIAIKAQINSAQIKCWNWERNLLIKK